MIGRRVVAVSPSPGPWMRTWHRTTEPLYCLAVSLGHPGRGRLDVAARSAGQPEADPNACSINTGPHT